MLVKAWRLLWLAREQFNQIQDQRTKDWEFLQKEKQTITLESNTVFLMVSEYYQNIMKIAKMSRNQETNHLYESSVVSLRILHGLNYDIDDLQ